MVLSPLFQGLVAPEPLKLDTSGLDAFLQKLLLAVVKTDTDLQAVRAENVTLRAEVEALKAASKKRTDTDSMRDELSKVIERLGKLEKTQVVLSEKIEIKADIADVQAVQQMAESAKQTADATAEELRAFKADYNKTLKELRAQVFSLNNLITEQVTLLSDTKANKSDVTDLKKMAEGAISSCDKNTAEMDKLTRLVNDFISKVETSIGRMADIEMLKDKMGRLECDDLLNRVQRNVTEKLRKMQKDAQELRDDLDVILTMIMQDSNVGAGMLKCLSCEKPVALHKPGPPPGIGREPVLVHGQDHNFYRASKEPSAAGGGTEGQYSPRWASSTSPDIYRGGAGSSIRSPGSSLGHREKSPPKQPRRPQSAKART
mmetsp:Transcript_33619/g.82678  ORF Transcript_33619/g.82678 Transcript_33619/m.82678 type:complete len:374 (+) Transcript_33619:56-1177(+)